MLSTESSPAIRAEGLTKRFGRFLALDDFHLRVQPGEIHGFLGPNGAGKSTTIRILLGLMRRDAGVVEVFGRDPWSEPTVTNRDVAYVPGDVSLWPGLTGGQTIDLLLRLRGGGDPVERDRLLARFELDPRKRARTYSKGNRQKVALVAAFARRAPLYILDEPTSGLDPLMEAVFREEIRRVRDRGSTVLLSSHLLSEVEQLCDRVTMIRAGRHVETTRLDDLVRGTATRFEVGGVRGEALAGLPGVSDLADDGAVTRFEVTPMGLAGVLEVLGRSRAASVSATAPTLESVFLRHYETQGE